MSGDSGAGVSRRQQILEALANELERSPSQRITTAGLARAVGVSEAALYRHFPSKARMFEGLIEFIEESVFGLIGRIRNETSSAAECCAKIMLVLLGFAARNPGITRILTGNAMVGETERLHHRVGQLFDRVESQLKQILREAELAGELHDGQFAVAGANLLLAVAEGKMDQYVRSGFKRSPLQGWDEQWSCLAAAIFRHV